jgi:osmotically-inducible protein OsmY
MQIAWRQITGYGACLFILTLTGCVGCPSRGPVQYAADTRTTQKVKHAIQASQPRDSIITVKTFDQTVSLGGTVNSPEAKDWAVATARKINGVRVVLDYIQVKNAPGNRKT